MKQNIIAQKIYEYRNNPAQMVREQFKIEPDPWQLECLEAFADPLKKRIALKACVGPGKTAVLAWCAWNFLLCYGGPGEHPKGAAVAITEDNLRSNLWTELAKWQQVSPMLSRMFVHTRERIFAKDHEKDWWLMARSFAQKADKASLGRTLSGIHSPYMLFILDETGEMPPEILQAAEQAMSSGKWAKILQAGNPMSLDGTLHKACVDQKHLWQPPQGQTITITGDPDDPMRSNRINIQWAKDQIALFGRDNPWVMYSILGLFPPMSVAKLLGPDDVKAAMDRTYSEEAIRTSDKRYGIDVARFGDDRTAACKRQGLVCSEFIVMRNARTNEIADRIMYNDEAYASDMMAVDDTGGYGAGVIDQLLLRGKSPLAVNFASSALDSDHFFNRRAEMWWNMAEWVKRGGSLPVLPELIKELTEVSYVIQNGKVRLEEKEQIKSRLGFSPDLGDALALTFAVPDAPRRAYRSRSVGHADSEYDVLEDRSHGVQAREFEDERGPGPLRSAPQGGGGFTEDRLVGEPGSFTQSRG